MYKQNLTRKEKREVRVTLLAAAQQIQQHPETYSFAKVYIANGKGCAYAWACKINAEVMRKAFDYYLDFEDAMNRLSRRLFGRATTWFDNPQRAVTLLRKLAFSKFYP